MTEFCSACSRRRPLGELLVVTDRATGRQRYVCRPSAGIDRCFGSVGPASIETIAQADPAAQRPDHRAPYRPPWHATQDEGGRADA